MNDFSNRECPNIGRVRESLQGCKDVCMVKQGCTGFNYNHKTRSCVMRGCSLPVKPPARNHCDDEYAFWLALTTTGSCKYGMSSKKTSVSYRNFFLFGVGAGSFSFFPNFYCTAQLIMVKNGKRGTNSHKIPCLSSAP